MLDVVGFNYADSRYELDAELFPHRVIVGSETFPEKIDVMWGLVERLPHVIGDFTWTGWDYLGEAGIGRVDYTDAEGYVPTGTAGPYPYLLAESRRHRHHGPPPHDLVLPRDRLRPAHRPVHRRAPPAAPRAARRDDAVVVGRRGRRRGRGMPRPARRSSIDVYADADEVELLLDGASLGVAPVGEAEGVPRALRDRVPPGRARRGRARGRRRDRPAHAAHSIRCPVARRPGGGRRASRRTGSAFVAITLEDAAGIVPDRRRSPRDRRGRGPARARGRRHRPRAHRGVVRRSLASRPTTAGRSRSCARPAPARSP